MTVWFGEHTRQTGQDKLDTAARVCQPPLQLQLAPCSPRAPPPAPWPAHHSHALPARRQQPVPAVQAVQQRNESSTGSTTTRPEYDTASWA